MMLHDFIVTLPLSAGLVSSTSKPTCIGEVTVHQVFSHLKTHIYIGAFILYNTGLIARQMDTQTALFHHGRDISWEASQSLSSVQGLSSHGIEMVQSSAVSFSCHRCTPSQKDQLERASIMQCWRKWESGGPAQLRGTVSHCLPSGGSLQCPGCYVLMAGTPASPVILLDPFPKWPPQGQQQSCSRRGGHKPTGELSFSPRREGERLLQEHKGHEQTSGREEAAAPLQDVQWGLQSS